MDTKLQSVIDRVQKLLSLSNSSNANEAANAAAIANKLIDQYRLSEIDLSISNKREEEIIVDDGFIYETGKVTTWKQSLILILAKHYGVANFNDCVYPEGRKITRIKLIGYRNDIEIVRYMARWLINECIRLSTKEAYGKGRVYVTSYCTGFVIGIKEQLNKSRKEIVGDSVALVKMDSRYSESNSFMNEKFRLRRIKTMSHCRIDGIAFGEGKDRGTSIHLGNSLNGGTTKFLGR
jgi:hypothetical protein